MQQCLLEEKQSSITINIFIFNFYIHMTLYSFAQWSIFLKFFFGFSGFIFLRLLCPAILNPKSFNLITGIVSFSILFVVCISFLCKIFFFRYRQVHLYVIFPCLPETPSDVACRTLKLIAKALQNLANLVEFGIKVRSNDILLHLMNCICKKDDNLSE